MDYSSNKKRLKLIIIDLIDYNLLFCQNFVNLKQYSNFILWVIFFVSIRKSLKEWSLEHFGSAEHKVL